MTEVEKELNKATTTVQSPTFEALITEAKKADEEKSAAYRLHIQELIKNDFAYITYTLGGSRLEATLKRDGLQQICALILQMIKESVVQNENEAAYHSEGNGGNIGYA